MRMFTGYKKQPQAAGRSSSEPTPARAGQRLSRGVRVKEWCDFIDVGVRSPQEHNVRMARHMAPNLRCHGCERNRVFEILKTCLDITDGRLEISNCNKAAIANGCKVKDWNLFNHFTCLPWFTRFLTSANTGITAPQKAFLYQKKNPTLKKDWRCFPQTPGIYWTPCQSYQYRGEPSKKIGLAKDDKGHERDAACLKNAKMVHIWQLCVCGAGGEWEEAGRQAV